jgi:hypothetical protein
MNINEKILNKIQTEFNTLKRSYTMIKLVSLHGCKDGSAYVNQEMQFSTQTESRTKIMIILVDAV